MKRVNEYKWLVLVLRILLGLIFLCAGVIKSREAQSFGDSIASFDVLPNSIINLLALTLPPFEIIIGCMLIFGWKARVAALSAVFLFGVFVIGLGQAIIRGINVDCGCFGSQSPSFSKTWSDLGRDIALLVVAAWVYFKLTCYQSKADSL